MHQLSIRLLAVSCLALFVGCGQRTNVETETTANSKSEDLPKYSATQFFATPGKVLRGPAYVTTANGYVDESAVKCPSSWDEVAKRFRNENYWIFQKKEGDKDISMVLRPNRDTGTWNTDVDTVGNPMTITPDYYEWESAIFTGINTLNIKDFTLDRKRTDSRSAISQCELVSPEAARDAVESRYQRRLEGNNI